VIPWATFVEPEVARVGLNEQEAKEKGIAYEVSRYGIDDLDRAIADGEAHGFVKVLTVPGKDRILGVTIVGEHAGDLIAEYVLAMKHGIGLNKILGTIHIYPTLAEANKYVAGVWKKAHARVVCASIGCPMLRPEAFTAEKLDAQLDDGMKRFLADSTRNRYDAGSGKLHVSKIFDWYGKDFEKAHKGYDSLKTTFARHAAQLAATPEAQAKVRNGDYKLDFLEYDWKLNDSRRRGG
jgi:hypothetical protein